MSRIIAGSFSDTMSYKGIRKRKEKLVKKLMNTPYQQWPDILPLTKVFKEDDVENLIGFLNCRDNTDNEHKYSIYEELPRVTVNDKNGSSVCDFLCVEYFRLYSVSEDETKIQRYSYFECYYDGYVISCIIDAVAIERNKAFIALDMDAREWGKAKQQMRYWNKIIIPEIEELPRSQKAYPLDFQKRMHHYDRRTVNVKQQSACSYPDADNPLWKIVTYLNLLQILPILPKESIPGYYLNLVCKGKGAKEDCAKKLKMFLEGYYKHDPIISENILLSQHMIQNQFHESDSNAAKPYVVVLDKQSDLRQIKDQMNYYVAEDPKRKTHPFRKWVPICVNDQYVLDSTALNVEILDLEKIDWNIKLGRIKTTCARIYRDCYIFSKKSMRSRLKQVTAEVRKIFKEYAIQNGIGKRTWDNIVKYEGNTLDLAVWFVFLWNHEVYAPKPDDKIFEWMLSLLAELIKKQTEVDLVVDGLMLEFRKEYENIQYDGRPYLEDYDLDAGKVFRDIVGNISLLCFHPKYFEEWLQEKTPYVETDTVLDRLYEREVLHTKKDNKRRYGIKLNYRNKVNKEPSKVRDYIAIKM